MDEQKPFGLDEVEFWRSEVAAIIQNELDEQHTKIIDMCNAIKSSTPETLEMSRQQHTETIAKISELLNALNVGLKAFYILIASLVALGLIGLGTIMFTASLLMAK